MRRILALLVIGVLLAGCTQYGGNQYTPPSGGNGGPSMGSGGNNPPPSQGNGSMMNGTPPSNGTMTPPPSMNESNGTVNAPWSGGTFNTPGNVLITDQFNNRVIEVDPATNKIVWSFGSGNGSACDPGPGTVIAPNWAERLPGGRTIMAGTGVPASDSGPGCPDNRVIIVDQFGKIVWQYGSAGVSGDGLNQLDTPTAAIALKNGDFLITDQGNNRIIEVDSGQHVVWRYGPQNGSGALDSPNSAEMLDNGNVLIADENNNRTIEVARNGSIVWEYGKDLGAVAFASRLPNGDTLITDSGNNRVIEVTPSSQVVWQYYTNSSADSNPSPEPTNAVRYWNYTMIADQFNHRAFAVDAQGAIAWQFGKTNAAGSGADGLNGPYTAFVIGDYTGQTVPPAMTLTSPSFQNGSAIPAQFTCEGNNTSPELMLSNVPAGTKSIALTVFDTDASFVHWVAWNFEPGTRDIPQNESGMAVEGMNGLGASYTGPWPKNGYIGPCPPPGSAHHYHFRAYALDSMLDMPPSGNMTSLMQAMLGHAIIESELVGTYKCSKDTAAADGLCR